MKHIIPPTLYLWLLSFFLAWPIVGATQETASGDHVKIRWLAPDAFASGKTEPIGFYFEVDSEWHVYWRNAGDSGAAPQFNVQAEGATTAPIQWPFPKRLPIEHLTNLGYAGNVAYLLPVTPDKDAAALSLTVDLEWLVCKVDCIPGFGEMTLERPVAASANPAVIERSTNYVSDALDAGMKGEPIKVKSSRAYGCLVKY